MVSMVVVMVWGEVYSRGVGWVGVWGVTLGVVCSRWWGGSVWDGVGWVGYVMWV